MKILNIGMIIQFVIMSKIIFIILLKNQNLKILLQEKKI